MLAVAPWVPIRKTNRAGMTLSRIWDCKNAGPIHQDQHLHTVVINGQGHHAQTHEHREGTETLFEKDWQQIPGLKGDEGDS